MTQPAEEFAATSGHWLVRAYYTPVSDALRGHLSARLDVRREIAVAGLPALLGQLTYSVVRGTRLWRREKSDVARELLAHFADGLAAGRTPEQLLADFGPADHAARLIRRAKLRHRPRWWRACRFAWLGLLAILGVSVLCYGLLSARLYLARPSIARNYWLDVNQARKFPDDQRAWLVYRDAVFKIGRDYVEPDNFAAGLEHPRAIEARARLDRHHDALLLIRRASAMPHMGYLLGDPDDNAAASAAGAKGMTSSQRADDNETLISALLIGPQEMRSLARFLAGDARRAALAGDGESAFDDVVALVGMAEQHFEPPVTLVEQLVGMAIFSVATESAGRILAETSTIWSDQQLRDLAHRFASFRGGNRAFDFSLERMLFDDLLQRAYTDDGQGDGRITPQGLGILAEYSQNYSVLAPLAGLKARREHAPAAAYLFGPGVAALVGSREENRALYHGLMDRMIAAHQGPAWTWDREVWKNQVKELGFPFDQRGRLRYWLVGMMFPAMEAAFDAVERNVQLQTGVETAIALELWRRRHGDWPQSLAVLVPGLLPGMPLDRVDGRPLGYVVRDGRPVLYSLGHDGDDDGGRASKDRDAAITVRFGRARPRSLEEPVEEPAESVEDDADGDWILWPPPPQDPADADPDDPREAARAASQAAADPATEQSPPPAPPHSSEPAPADPDPAADPPPDQP